MKKLVSMYQKYMFRPILYKSVTRVSVVAVLMLLWDRYVSDGTFTMWQAPALLLGVVLLMWAWVNYLRLDGVTIHHLGEEFKDMGKKKKFHSTKSIVDFADERIVSFEELEPEERTYCSMLSNLILGGALLIIGLIAGAVFGGSSLVAVSAYFIGMAAIICSGIILKKTKLFAGDPAPFVMELPAYHVPAWGNVLRATWERGWSFIKRAGSVILLATVVLWFLQGFGFENGAFGMVEDQDNSVLAAIATKIAWIFAPLGWGNWQATVASITGLVAKENIVGTLGILYGGGDLTVYQNIAAAFTGITGYSFLVFNLLCAPCFAAIGAIKREMNNAKWTWFAIGYQCGFAYLIALMINQFGNAFTGSLNVIGLIAAIVVLAGMIYMLFKPYKEATKLSDKH